MAKYKVNWDAIEEEGAPVLVAAVARYLSVEEYPKEEHVAAILGIVKEEER